MERCDAVLAARYPGGETNRADGSASQIARQDPPSGTMSQILAREVSPHGGGGGGTPKIGADYVTISWKFRADLFTAVISGDDETSVSVLGLALILVR